MLECISMFLFSLGSFLLVILGIISYLILNNGLEIYYGEELRTSETVGFMIVAICVLFVLSMVFVA